MPGGFRILEFFASASLRAHLSRLAWSRGAGLVRSCRVQADRLRRAFAREACACNELAAITRARHSLDAIAPKYGFPPPTVDSLRCFARMLAWQKQYEWSSMSVVIEAVADELELLRAAFGIRE